MTKVLFICLANVCRSPAAEGILRHLSEKWNLSKSLEVASCGLGSWHEGQQYDQRMRGAAFKRGVSLSGRSKLFQPEFLNHYDYIFVTDQDVLQYVLQYAETADQKAKIHLVTAFSPSYKGIDIPDPYFGGNGTFEEVLDILEDACEGFLNHLKQKDG